MKFHSMKEWSTRDFGRNAATSILGGVILGTPSFGMPLFVQIIGDALLFVGILLLIIWITRKIKKA